jgi:hypothetical protein
MLGNVTKGSAVMQRIQSTHTTTTTTTTYSSSFPLEHRASTTSVAEVSVAFKFFYRDRVASPVL